MQTLIIIVSSFSGTFAFAFLLAGWAALIAIDKADQDEVARRVGPSPRRGFWRQFWFYWSTRWQVDRVMVARTPMHWRARPEARFFILAGVACFLAAIAGLSWIVATMPGQ